MTAIFRFTVGRREKAFTGNYSEFLLCVRPLTFICSIKSRKVSTFENLSILKFLLSLHIYLSFQVVTRVDGLICYMDASCNCESGDGASNCGSQNSCRDGIHSIDVLELEAMMRTIPPDLAPPVLVLLAHMDDPATLARDLDSCDVPQHRPASTTKDAGSYHDPATQKRHRPAMLYPILSKLDLPWAVCEFPLIVCWE